MAYAPFIVRSCRYSGRCGIGIKFVRYSIKYSVFASDPVFVIMLCNHLRSCFLGSLRVNRGNVNDKKNDPLVYGRQGIILFLRSSILLIELNPIRFQFSFCHQVGLIAHVHDLFSTVAGDQYCLSLATQFFEQVVNHILTIKIQPIGWFIQD